MQRKSSNIETNKDSSISGRAQGRGLTCSGQGSVAGAPQCMGGARYAIHAVLAVLCNHPPSICSAFTGKQPTRRQ